MYFFFQQSPTEVTLSDRQWEEHTAYFDCLLNEVASEQADAPGSIVLRGALMVARIASIFTALRKYEGLNADEGIHLYRRGFSCLHADRTNHPQPQSAGRLLTAGRENETSAYAVILPNPVGRREPT